MSSSLRPLCLRLSCAQTTQCRIDNDRQELEYCYKVALDPESAAGRDRAGLPLRGVRHLRLGLHIRRRLLRERLLHPKDLQRPEPERRPTVGRLRARSRGRAAASAYAPMLTCLGFADCMLARGPTAPTCNDRLQQVDPPSLQPANDLWNCLLTECDGASFAVCMNGPCENQKVMSP